jgi:SNF2 family DNA or RNA helicase
MHQFTLENFQVTELTNTVILRHSPEIADTQQRGFFDIQPQSIELNYAGFLVPSGPVESRSVLVEQNSNSLKLSCNCTGAKSRLCDHQIQVLYNLMNRKELRLFFDKNLRYERIRQVAKDYGLENESDPDSYFVLNYLNKEVQIKPKLKELLPVNASTVNYLRENLLPKTDANVPDGRDASETLKRIVVIGQHKYYDHFYIELLEGQQTRDGKIKNPLNSLNPLDFIWKIDNPEDLKFYSAISRFQNNYRTKTESDVDGIRAVVKNPLGLPFFYHNINISENRNSASLVPITLQRSTVDLSLAVDHQNGFYEVHGHLILDGRPFNLEKLNVSYDYFILSGDNMHFIDDMDVLRTIDFFKKNNNRILIHEAKFDEFKADILSNLERKVRIVYSYLKPATKVQLVEKGFDQKAEKIIYLVESGNYVAITPVMRYGDVEVPVFSHNQIHSADSKGNPFIVTRDADAEMRFTTELVRKHPDFQEQLGSQNFYLHKKSFLDDSWFLDVFEEWRENGISIMGFNKLTSNKLNLHKASISVNVVSGINWFNTTLNVKFGKQKATLKNLHKAIRNRTRFVQLDDGSTGILPQEWIAKFSRYFSAGEILEDQILTAKINFSGIAELYENEVLSDDVRKELSEYRERFSDFDSVKPIAVPEGLKTSLRDYQLKGLYWLNFLDEFGFGGCLADDMGLGKTVQIIAFILSQRDKGHHNTNLVVVPTSLIFNWLSEVEKFAPSIKVLTIYGSARVKEIVDFDQYEIILTSYGTLLGDIGFLKNYHFNYIFLDESQAIKNPESQRYKAARLLKSRNKIVLTGTPVENNTFDLYGQLSFACPGLLGNKTQFKNHFSIPIDQFHDTQRASELQKKINPFILRRTKRQVATELPDKTEMVLFCEMGEEQRRVYNAYEHEFRLFLNTKEEGDIARVQMHVLQGLTKLRQICDSPALLNDHEYYGDASSKIDVLIKQIESKSSQHKILIFSQFVTMLDLIKTKLEERKISFEYLTGQTRNRQARVDNFQNNPEVRVFLISLKAGGTGLNLTQADYVYLVDPWWNPAVENQAIDRSYRIGQNKNVIAVRLICPDTIEEKILHLQESKKDLADGLVKTDTAILKSLTKDDLLRLVLH